MAVAFSWSTLHQPCGLQTVGAHPDTQWLNRPSLALAAQTLSPSLPPHLTPSATQVQLFAGACGDKGLKTGVKVGLKIFVIF